MKIQFVIETKTFGEAAFIEKTLQGLKIGYKSRVDDKPSLGNGRKRVKHMKIGKAEILAVTTCIADHPSWIHKDVAKATGISRATVARIALGKHVLQKNGG